MIAPNQPSAHAPSPRIEVQTVGRDSNPIVIVDDLSADPEQLRHAARNVPWQELGDFYPGPRAFTGTAYLAAITPVLRAVLSRIYGLGDRAEVLRCYYSLATTAPADLQLAQRIPHVDAYDPRQIAMVHYLCQPEQGGTDFYRHRSTGFERIDPSRQESYLESLAADFAALGQPTPAYINAASPYFERIGGCEAAFNRAVFFPGNLLHCAALDGVTLVPDPVQGRLTIAAFIQPTQDS